MERPHQSQHHSNHQRMPNKPTSLALNQQHPNFERMGGSAAATSSGNGNGGQQLSANWYEESFDLNRYTEGDGSFNLLDYINAEGSEGTPISETGPGGLEGDEIDKRKAEAQYEQMQFDGMIHDEEFQHQRHDYLEMQNDFASVPGYREEPPYHQMGAYTEMGEYHQQEDELVTPQAQTAAPWAVSGTSSAGGNFSLAHNLDRVSLVPSTSHSSIVQPLTRLAPVKAEIVKQEPSEHQEEFALASGGVSISSRASSVASNANSIYTTATTTTSRLNRSTGLPSKPRKYRIKPDSEKQNPQYRVKRQKNNDAVRRSRDKAKQHQAEKEARLEGLEDQVRNQEHLIAVLEAENVKLRDENQRLKQQCRCGATSGKHRR